MILDQYTFGNSSAAINLADMLNKIQDEKITAKVQNKISGILLTCNQIKRIDDANLKYKIFEILYEKVKKQSLALDDNLLMPQKIKTHMYNVILTHLKIIRRIIKCH